MKHPSFSQFNEALSKGTWKELSAAEVGELKDDLIDLVRNAYRDTALGSYIKNSNQLMSSKWIALDHDEFDDIDACIFFRGSRPDEIWRGRKIQGIGHDGEPLSKTAVLRRLSQELELPGTWIEASGKLGQVLSRRLTPVADEKLIRRLFPKSDVIMSSDGSYTRIIDGNRRREFIFGNPKVDYSSS